MNPYLVVMLRYSPVRLATGTSIYARPMSPPVSGMDLTYWSGSMERMVTFVWEPELMGAALREAGHRD